jgi:ferredoxin-fold anticodon binding domain-containing protein
MFQKSAEWDSMPLYQKIDKYGSFISKGHNKYLNKVEVKDFITTNYPKLKIAKLVKTFNSVSDFKKEDIQPNLILKAVRGSGYLLDLREINDIGKIHKRMSHWKHIIARSVLENTPFFFTEEKINCHYNGITANACDYKIFCIHGEPKYILMRKNGTRNFYWTDWTPMRIQMKIERPEQLDELLKIAEQLSQPFEFVRIDLYLGNNGIYFGEYTFHCLGGRKEFDDEMELKLGKLWN